MLPRALRILACCLVTLAAYWFYSLVAVPWIEPSIQAQSRSDDAPRDKPPKPSNLDQLADLFPPGAWELQNPKLLKTEQGMLLFQDYKPVDSSQLELRPCTLVFFSEKTPDNPRGRPFVMRAPERAVLEFEGNVDLLKARLGRLRGGRLDGEISIYTPAAYTSPDQQLRIVTRNVQINQKRIWTPHELDFQWGPHHGKGRQLIIELGAGQRAAAGSQTGLHLGSIRSLELSKVEKLNLLLTGGGPLGPTTTTGGPSGDAEGPGVSEGPGDAEVDPKASTAASPPVPVELTCDGPFRVEFQENTASFEENVDVVRLNPEGPSDALKCHRLTFYFKSSTEGAAANEAAPQPSPAARIDRVVAVGHPVELQLASMDASVRTELMEYRFASRTLHLRDDRGVQLRHQHHSVTAPELEYQLAENPREIGRLWAAGPGRFVSRPPQPDQPPMEAAWNGELRVTPEGDEHVVSLRNGASARLPNMGGFSAERLFIWLRESAADPPDPQPLEPATDPQLIGPTTGPQLIGPDISPQPLEQTTSPKPLGPATVQPTKLLAEGQVQFDSPQLSGVTKRLEVWFHTPPGDGAAGEPAKSEVRPGAAVNPVRPPDPSESNSGLRQQLRLRGDLIRLQLVNRKRWNVEHVSVLGDVLLSQQTEQANVEPLTVRGETLEVDNGLAGRGQLDITGSPAMVAAQGMSVVGPNLHLRQRDNRLWMDGPGSMTLPPTGPSANPAASSFTSVPAAGAVPGSSRPGLGGAGIPVTIRWQGGMRFNGHTATFDREVETGGQQRMEDGTLNDLSITAAMLEVELTDMLNFSDPRAGKVDVKQLRFLADRNGVRLTNQGRGANGLPQSIDRMLVGRLTLEGTSGLFQADGPGWISTTRYGRDCFLTPGSAAGGSAPARPGTPAPSRPPAPSLPPTPSLPIASTAPRADVLPRLVHLFVSFDEGITGNMYQREFHFLRRVQVIYGPVTTWDTELRGKNLEQLPAGSVVMECDRLAVADMGQGGPAQFELLATGNTLVEGLTHHGRFAAQAHRLSYVQAKDLLVMEGDGRRDATWQGQRAGGPGLSRAAARKILYSRTDGRVEVDSFQYLNLGQ